MIEHTTTHRLLFTGNLIELRTALAAINRVYAAKQAAPTPLSAAEAEKLTMAAQLICHIPPTFDFA